MFDYSPLQLVTRCFQLLNAVAVNHVVCDGVQALEDECVGVLTFDQCLLNAGDPALMIVQLHKRAFDDLPDSVDPGDSGTDPPDSQAGA